jgi:pimeloyl-ACP methyl ester carboxylesterase
VPAVASAAGAWLRDQRAPVVLVGHSTGAQAALRAGVAEPGAVASLVLLGPVFEPSLRRLPALARAVPPAYRRDAPRQVPAVLPDVLHGHVRLWPLLSSGMRERPEDLVGRVRAPLTLASGAADRMAPRWWLERLAAGAGAGAGVGAGVGVGVATLPGSHNCPFTHARAVAALLRQVTGP